MNYIKSTEKVCENDIILTHKFRGDEDRLAIVNSIDEENQLICCTLIESTKVVYSKVFKCTLVKHATEAEARKYAKDAGAIFKTTSACTAAGIEDLFKSIGCKILNPNYSEDDDAPSKSGGGQQTTQPQKSGEKDGGKIKLGGAKPKEKEKKKGFC